MNMFLSESGGFVCENNVCGFRTIQLPMRKMCETHGNNRCRCGLKLKCGCVEVFNTLRYFRAFFEKSHENDDEFKEFREYMLEALSAMLECHGFACIRIADIFANDESQTESSYQSIETQEL